MGILESPWRYAPKATVANANAVEFQRYAEAKQLANDDEERQRYISFARLRAQENGLDPDIFQNQIGQESGFNPRAFNQKSGATGIAQIMPNFHPNVNPNDPYDSLGYAARLMGGYLKKYDGDYELALAAYNAGEGNVAEAGGVPDFPETQTYIKKILGERQDVKRWSASRKQQAEWVKTPMKQNASDTGVIGEAVLAAQTSKYLAPDEIDPPNDLLANLTTGTLPSRLELNFDDWPIDMSKPMKGNIIKPPMSMEAISVGGLGGAMVAGPPGALVGAAIPIFAPTALEVAKRTAIPAASAVLDWLQQNIIAPWEGALSYGMQTNGQSYRFVKDTIQWQFEEAERISKEMKEDPIMSALNTSFLMQNMGELYLAQLGGSIADAGKHAQVEIASGRSVTDVYDDFRKAGNQLEQDDPLLAFALSMTHPINFINFEATAFKLSRLVPAAGRAAIHEAARVATLRLLEPSKTGLVKDAMKDGVNGWNRYTTVLDDPAINLTQADLLANLRSGTLDSRLMATISGKSWTARRDVEALQELVDVGKADPAIFDPLLERVHLLSSEELSAGLGGILTRARADRYGIKLDAPNLLPQLAAELMGWWRHTVLSTPQYVAQNFMEDYFRLWLYGYNPILSGWDQILFHYGDLVPLEIRQGMMPFAERLKTGKLGNSITDILAGSSPSVLRRVSPMMSKFPEKWRTIGTMAQNVFVGSAAHADTGAAVGLWVGEFLNVRDRMQFAEPIVRNYISRLDEVKAGVLANRPKFITEAEVEGFFQGMKSATGEKEILGLGKKLAGDPYRAARLGPPNNPLPIRVIESLKQQLKTVIPQGEEAISKTISAERRKLPSYIYEAQQEAGQKAYETLRAAAKAESADKSDEAMKLIDKTIDNFVNRAGLEKLELDAIEAGGADWFKLQVADNRAMEFGIAARVIAQIGLRQEDTITALGKAGFPTAASREQFLKRINDGGISVMNVIDGVNDEAFRVWDRFRDATWDLSKALKGGAVNTDELWMAYALKYPEAATLSGAAPSPDLLWRNYFGKRQGYHRKRIDAIIDAVNNNFLKLDADELRVILPKPSEFVQMWNEWLDVWENMAKEAAAIPPTTRRKAIRQFWTDAVAQTSRVFRDAGSEAALQNAKIQNFASQMGMDRARQIMNIGERELNIDRIMKTVSPFWFFPSRAHPFYVGTALRKPWTLNVLARWFDETQPKEPGTSPRFTGMLNMGFAEPLIPGAKNIWVNPFRFMGIVQFYQERPSEIYSATDPTGQRAIDILGQVGVGLQPAITQSLPRISRAYRGMTDTPLFDENARDLIPQIRWVRGTVNHFARSIFHSETFWDTYKEQGYDIPKGILENVPLMGEPGELWSYNVGKEMAGRFQGRVQAFEEATGRPIKPSEGAALMEQVKTEEGAEARSKVDIESVLGAMFGFKVEYPGEIERRTSRAEILRDQYGISFETQMEYAKKGAPLLELLNNEQRADLFKKHPEWAGWSKLIPPESNPVVRRVYVDTADYRLASEAARQEAVQKLIPINLKVASLDLSGNRYRDLREEILGKYRTTVENLHTGENPTYPYALVTNEERAAFKQKIGQEVLPAHPEDIALDTYWSITPDQFKDEQGNTNWRGYFGAQEQYLAAQSPDIRAYIERYESRWLSDLKAESPKAAEVELAYRQSRKDYQTYQSIPKYMGFSPEQGDAIDKLLVNVADWRGRLPYGARTTKNAIAMMMVENPQMASQAMVAVQIAQKLRNPARTIYWGQSTSLQLFFSDTAGEDWPAILRPTIAEILAGR